MKDILEEYHKHARELIPVLFFTVMMWMAIQNVIAELIRMYAPPMTQLVLALFEILIASFGLWYFTKSNKR